MSETRTEILTGAVVLAAAIAFAAYAGLGRGLTDTSGSYPLKASFRSVEGISVGTDVRMAGVKVGSVTALSLNPQTFFADAVIAVQNGIALPDDSAVLISSEGLLGGNFVELMPGGSPMNLGPGDEIEDTQGSVSIISLMMKFAGGGGEADSGGEAGAQSPGTDSAPATTAP